MTTALPVTLALMKYNILCFEWGAQWNDPVFVVRCFRLRFAEIPFPLHFSFSSVTAFQLDTMPPFAHGTSNSNKHSRSVGRTLLYRAQKNGERARGRERYEGGRKSKSIFGNAIKTSTAGIFRSSFVFARLFSPDGGCNGKTAAKRPFSWSILFEMFIAFRDPYLSSFCLLRGGLRFDVDSYADLMQRLVTISWQSRRR